jgi:hypothetical protein
MNAGLAVLLLGICGATIFLAPQEAPGALAFCAVFSLPTIIILARGKERVFLLRLFVAAMIVRLVIGVVIFNGHMQEFFGGDANTYDIFGRSLIQAWAGDEFHRATYERFVQSGAGAWGMIYLVAFVYTLIGRNMLAIQFINASVGAATAPVIFHIAHRLFSNRRVSKWAAYLTAFFPSLILWSSQGLKDGLIVMALALSIILTLQLMEKVTFWRMLILSSCLLILMSLRFYIFYMMAAAVVGAFIIGMKSSNATAYVQRFIAVILIGLALTWVGVLQSAGQQFDKFANLDAVQRSRSDLAQSADSGFGKDVDVRTTGGALTIIPIGLVYLLFAPFPWQLASLRQSIALPRNDRLVACVSTVDPGLLVRDKTSVAGNLSDSSVHFHADPGVFTVSGKRRNSIPTTVAVAGFLLHLCRRRCCFVKGASRRSRARSFESKTRSRDLQAARILARRRAPESQPTT